MNPIKLEIFLDDKTLAGMRSVQGNVSNLEALTTEMLKRLKLELKDLEKQYKVLQGQGLAGDKEMADIQALKGAIGGLKEQLKEYQKVKKQTNETPIVGDDPAPKLNSVKMSMQQIARELPSLAMGPQMFFLAISNNIPMFTDAVGNARKEYARLTASGQKATPVWKQLLKSLFSWQTAMAAAITLTVVYGKEIGAFFSNLFSGSRKVYGLAEAQKELNETMGSTDTGIGNNLVSLKKLQEKWNALGNDLSARKRFISENKDEFDKLNVAVTDVSDAENLLVENTEAFITAMKLRAKAAAAQKLAAEKYEESIRLQLKAEEERKRPASTMERVAGSMATVQSRGMTTETGEDIRERGVRYLERQQKAAEDAADAMFRLGVETEEEAEKVLKAANIKNKVKNKPEKPRGGNNGLDYQTELANARLRAQQKLEAALVAVKQEGYEKRRELAKLEYQAELADIDKREKKMTEKLDNARKNGRTVTPEEYRQVKDNANIERSAALISYEGELDKINEEASSAERKKLEEYARQFQGYITKRTFTEKGFDTKRDALKNDGASKETLAELDYQKNKALEDIDREFAGREAAFQAWAANVVNLSLEELRRLLVEAEQELERKEFLHPDDKGLASRRAKVTTLKNTITEKTNNPGKGKDTKRSIKEWSELNRVLGDVEASFDDIGGAVGDVAGDIIKTAGTIATSTLSIIDGITQLSENSSESMKGTAEVAAETMSNVEKASVILAIISAALKVATAIAGLFKRTDYMEEFRKEMAKLNYELELTKLNAEISTDKNSIFGDDLWGNAIKNVTLANDALNRYNRTLDKISNRKKYTGFSAAMAEALGLKNTYDSLGDSIANMQVRIQHKTLFRSAKYSSLKDAVPELFNADGTVNQDALEKFIGTDTFGKLSAENQQYLREMSDYWKAYQDAVEKVNDYLTDIFGDLGGTLTDILVDSWVNGTDAAKDYYNSVSEMLEKLGTQMIYSSLFSDIFEKAQKKMLDVTKNEDLSADEKFKEYIKLLGGMTDEVLGKQGDFNALLEAYQQMAKDKGFDLFRPDEDGSQQNGRTGAFTTLTQEQGTKLEGLFTSLQDHASAMHKLLEELMKSRAADTDIFREIAENTAYCKYLEDIYEILEYLKMNGLKMQ